MCVCVCGGGGGGVSFVGVRRPGLWFPDRCILDGIPAFSLVSNQADELRRAVPFSYR